MTLRWIGASITLGVILLVSSLVSGTIGHPSGVTLGNFERIEIGMTRAQVRDLLGSWGHPISRIAIDGPTTISYLWMPAWKHPLRPCPPLRLCDGTITVSFSAERVVGKKQSGL